MKTMVDLWLDKTEGETIKTYYGIDVNKIRSDNHKEIFP